MKHICADTGFLIGLYDERDEFHERATNHFVQLFERGVNRLVLPWPVVYETLSTRMTRNRKALGLLEKDWKRLASTGRLDLLSDVPFRDEVVDECFDQLNVPPHRYRSLSAADRVIRRILADNTVRIHAFVTFNPGDFADVCRVLKCEILN